MNPPPPSLDDLRIKRNAPAPARRSGSLVLIVVLLLVAGAVIWWFARPKNLEVRTAAARAVTETGANRTVLNASGYVTARREATVSSKVTGKVVEILVEEGIRVDAGQVLARLDDSNVRTSLLLAEAQLEFARAGLEEIRVRRREAEQELERQKSLIAGNVAAPADYDRAEAAALALRARLAQQESTVTVADRTIGIWQQQLEDTVIRAPFAGIVTSKNAQPGEMISPMSSGGFTRTGICTIVDMDSREIEIDVNESYINRVTPGQEVTATLDAYADWKISCKVIAIIPTADRQKSTVRVRVGFDQLEPRILPEMAVKVAFRESNAATAGPAAPLVVVPKAAIQNANGRDYVFIVTQGRVERRAVTVVSTQDQEVTLRAGVAAGEKVAIDVPAGLADGTAVREKTL